MKPYMRVALLVLVSLVLAGCSGRTTPAPAADTFGDDCRPAGGADYVFGKVTDASKAPLAGANVTAKALTHSHQVSDETDAAGCYAIELAPEQPHDLTASKAGYQAKTEKSVWVKRDEDRKVNFELSR
jgi:carboxypeptidase family protein